MTKSILQDSQKMREWQKYYKRNNYYHKSLQKLAAYLIPKHSSVIEFGCKGGELLSFLPNTRKMGVELDDEIAGVAKKSFSEIRILSQKFFFKKNKKEKFDYVLLSHVLSETDDIQAFIRNFKSHCHADTRVVIFYFNFLWKPILDFGEHVGLKRPQGIEQNWLTESDIDNLFILESFEKVKSGKTFLFPYEIPFFSYFVNRYLTQLPFFNSFCLVNYSVFKIVAPKRVYSVSVIIPARNEAGNIPGILKRIPRMGKSVEVIFVEGHSKDSTLEAIKREVRSYKGSFKVDFFRQKGKGKADAVRLGFSKSKGELLMILDADLTVDPGDLPKFYEAISSGKGDLIIGCRLVYPMKRLAMKYLNYLGNKFFSLAFSFLLGQKIKDTLCGTKAILRKDYLKIERNRGVFGDFDPFGDFDLLFGAAKLNLKMVEIPVRYKERTYGETNISRFKHGLLLLRMTAFAAKKLKFI